MSDEARTGTLPLPEVRDLDGILAVRARIATAVIESSLPAEAAAVLPSAASAIVAAYLAAGHRSVVGRMEVGPDGGLHIRLQGGDSPPGHPVLEPPRVTLPPLLPGGVVVREVEGGACWSIRASGAPGAASTGGPAALYEAESTFLRLVSSRGEAGFPPVPLAPLVDELAAAFRGRADRGGIALEVRPPSSGLQVRGDRDRLFGLLADLLGNAFRFSREGDRISVQAELEAGEGEGATAVRISVSDTGPGMPAHVLEDLFTWNWIPGNPPPQGGPGFALARREARAMGGELLAESREGEGTRIHLVLPLEPAG